MNRQILSLSIGLLTLVTIPSLSFANHDDWTGNASDTPHHDTYFKGEHDHGKHCHMMRDLNLTQSQKEQLKAKRSQFKQENQASIEQMRASAKQLRELRRAQGGNSAEAEKLHQQLKQQHEQLRTKREAMMRQVLTPDQFAQFQQKKEQCKAQFKNNGKWGQKQRQAQ